MFRRLRAPETPAFRADETVAPGMRIAAAWSWRFLVVAGAIAVLIFLVIQLRLLIIPLLIGVLLASLLQPFSSLLQRKLRFPKWLAVITAMVTLLGTVTGLVWLVVSEIRAGYASIEARAIERYGELIVWATETFGLSENTISDWIANAIDELEIDPDFLLSGALSVGSTAAEVATGAILALFALLFFLIDGPRIWAFIVRLFPKPARVPVDGAGKAGWLTLSNFAKVQIFVAFVDAVGIGLGAVILQLPLALPIAVAVFLGSFVPIVGAVVTGALSVFIAIKYNSGSTGRLGTWQNRIEHFMDGDADGNYQVRQSKIAIATGEIIGKGPGRSVQRNFLPHPYSDFIYAIIIEEYGLIGGFGILMLYLVLLYRGVKIASDCPRTFGSLLAIGLCLSLVFQAMINMAVAVNLFPVTGQPLPMISMGGTSIWFTCITIGIILSVSRENEQIARKNIPVEIHH